MIAPYYQDDFVTLYHGDCRDVLPGLGVQDAIVTDPPYGLGKRWTGGTWFTRGAYEKENMEWDGKADNTLLKVVLPYGRQAVVWGGNYFMLPPARCWLLWTKPNAVPTMADFEMAWTTLDRPSKAFSHNCNGWARVHPTEKPLALLTWCLSLIAGGVLDPFAGSGTTLVAAKALGRKAIGIEIEERYCEMAAKRMSQEVLAL